MARNYIKEWGESGSFRPYLVPDDASIEKLREVQDGLVESLAPSHPLIKKVDDLHATIFYMKPVEFLDYLRERVNPDISRDAFYVQLMHSVSILLLTHDPSETEVRVGRIRAVGDDHSVAALTLYPGDFDEASLSTRRDVQEILRSFGVTRDVAHEMAQDKRFRWLMGHNLPHISLATGTQDPSAISYQPGPFSIRFMPEVGVGSATAGPIEPGERLLWHLRGIPGDPLLEQMGKNPEALLLRAD